MKPKVLLAVLGLSVIAEAKRPPWYKPCWIYMCGLDLTDPVCAWDPHHGARLFRNNCDMDRHNFCYNRNYAMADSSNTAEQDIRLCKRLQDILANSDKKTPLVEDGNIRVHFIEDPNRKKQRHEDEDKSEDRAREFRLIGRERERDRDDSLYPLFDRYGKSHKAGHKGRPRSLDPWTREDSDTSFSSAMN